VLTNDERRRVERALATVLMSRTQPLSLIAVVFLREPEPILLGIPTGSTSGEIAAFTLSACLRSGWTQAPPLLERLLEYLVTNALRGEFQGLLDRVRRREDPNPSLYDSSWILGLSRPFFDRHELRGQVRKLVEEIGRPILRVSADENSFGRSYTGRFFEHLASDRAAGRHVAIAQVSRGAGPGYRIDDLLGDLSTHFRKIDRWPERDGSSYPTAAARWLLRQMMNNDGLWLVVLDGFGQRPLTEEVREAVEELAHRVTVGEHRQRIRLVLLDYPHTLPNVSVADVLEEKLTPSAAIGRADLLPCLEAWDDLRRKNGLAGIAPEELPRVANDLVDRAPADGKPRLETLNAWLTDLLGME
jgi:hypothetical protein